MNARLPAWDITRILLAVVAIGGLIAASFLVVRPFLPAVIWATMFVGPVVLAVTYTLLVAWVARGDAPPE